MDSTNPARLGKQGQEQKMKYEIFRADLNKIVLKEIDTNSEEEAFGKYASALMLAGMIAMHDSATAHVEGNKFRVNTVAGKSFIVEVRAI